MNKFEVLGLNAGLLKAVEDMGFESPSEVQEKAIPILLQEKTDMVALAQTGTGKTAAFGFPLIQKINPQTKKTQGLILSPTRELCLQITNELKNYSKYSKGVNVVAVYGGASISEQANQIKRGAQIIVATPGRMQDMVNRRMVDISAIDYCILDEADEMLNMGFFEDITAILSHTPKEKNTWLFSATMPKEVAIIAKKFMHNPVEITVGAKNKGTSTVSHQYFVVGARDRYAALKRLADANPEIFSVIFCRTKRDTQKVAEQLIEDGYNAAAIHGDLSQNQRDLVMKSFRSRQIQILVATDVAARGIDVDDITHVINYQLPDEVEIYTHRSGRTGRAGKSGISIVIITKSELRKIKNIERVIGQTFTKKEIPSGIEICETQMFHLANQIKNTPINEEIETYLPNLNKALEDFSKEELIKKFFSVEFTRFFSYYKKATDLNAKANQNGREQDGDETRFFINAGEKDGFDWMSLKDFLKETLELERDDLSRVETKENFSFFNVGNSIVDKVITTFNDFEYQGRNINVEVTKDSGKSRGKRRNPSADQSKKYGKPASSERRGKRRSGDSNYGERKAKKSGGKSNNIASSIKRRRSKK